MQSPDAGKWELVYIYFTRANIPCIARKLIPFKQNKFHAVNHDPSV